MKRFLIIPVCLVMFGIYSCSKPEGVGGKGVISGVVTYERYDHNNKLINIELAKKERVYIVYGNHTVFDDNVDSYIDGAYQFNYLRKGAYSVVAFEDCNTCDSQRKEVVQQVDLAKNKTEATGVNLVLRQNIKVNGGTATISGRVLTQFYANGGPSGLPYVNPKKQRVYLVYDTDSTFFDKVDTDANGYYRFQNMIIGNYTAYVYSGCNGCGGNLIPKEVQGTVTTKGGELTLDITIEQW